jgi:hypothetical protein
VLGGWLAGSLTACGGKTSSPPIVGGESDFLAPCDETCGDGFECIAGVCSQSCSYAADTCSSLEEGAVCVVEGTATNDAGHCDVPCSSDASCVSLGASASCQAGFCREDDDDADGDGAETGALPASFEVLELRVLGESWRPPSEDSALGACESRLRLKVNRIVKVLVWEECLAATEGGTSRARGNVPLEPVDLERVASVYQALQPSTERSCTDARRLTLDVRTDDGTDSYADDTHGACASAAVDNHTFVSGLDRLYDVFADLRR